MFITSGIYLPCGEQQSLSFSIYADAVEVVLPRAGVVALPRDGANEWSEGFERVTRFEDDPEGRLLEFATRDATGHSCGVTVYSDGKCRTRGMTHAMAHEPLSHDEDSDPFADFWLDDDPEKQD